MLELERAETALRKVRNIKETLDVEEADRFASYVEGLPAAILTNGLGQALATLLSKSGQGRKDPHYKLYECVQDWLCRDSSQAPYRLAEDLMDAIVSNDRQTYLRAQTETLSLLKWLKKFAVAYLKKDKGGRGD